MQTEYTTAAVEQQYRFSGIDEELLATIERWAIGLPGSRKKFWPGITDRTQVALTEVGGKYIWLGSTEDSRISDSTRVKIPGKDIAKIELKSGYLEMGRDMHYDRDREYDTGNGLVDSGQKIELRQILPGITIYLAEFQGTEIVGRIIAEPILIDYADDLRRHINEELEADSGVLDLDHSTVHQTTDVPTARQEKDKGGRNQMVCHAWAYGQRVLNPEITYLELVPEWLILREHETGEVYDDDMTPPEESIRLAIMRFKKKRDRGSGK